MCVFIFDEPLLIFDTPNLAFQLDYAEFLSDGRNTQMIFKLRQTDIQNFHRLY